MPWNHTVRTGSAEAPRPAPIMGFEQKRCYPKMGLAQNTGEAMPTAIRIANPGPTRAQDDASHGTGSKVGARYGRNGKANRRRSPLAGKTRGDLRITDCQPTHPTHHRAGCIGRKRNAHEHQPILEHRHSCGEHGVNHGQPKGKVRKLRTAPVHRERSVLRLQTGPGPAGGVSKSDANHKADTEPALFKSTTPPMGVCRPKRIQPAKRISMTMHAGMRSSGMGQVTPSVLPPMLARPCPRIPPTEEWRHRDEVEKQVQINAAQLTHHRDASQVGGTPQVPIEQGDVMDPGQPEEQSPKSGW